MAYSYLQMISSWKPLWDWRGWSGWFFSTDRQETWISHSQVEKLKERKRRWERKIWLIVFFTAWPSPLTVYSSKYVDKTIFRICGFVTSRHITECPLCLLKEEENRKYNTYKNVNEKSYHLHAVWDYDPIQEESTPKCVQIPDLSEYPVAL